MYAYLEILFWWNIVIQQVAFKSTLDKLDNVIAGHTTCTFIMEDPLGLADAQRSTEEEEEGKRTAVSHSIQNLITEEFQKKKK